MGWETESENVRGGQDPGVYAPQWLSPGPPGRGQEVELWPPYHLSIDSFHLLYMLGIQDII